jgi:hypothetical protein
MSDAWQLRLLFFKFQRHFLIAHVSTVAITYARKWADCFLWKAHNAYIYVGLEPLMPWWQPRVHVLARVKWPASIYWLGQVLGLLTMPPGSQNHKFNLNHIKSTNLARSGGAGCNPSPLKDEAGRSRVWVGYILFSKEKEKNKQKCSVLRSVFVSIASC